MTKKLNRRHVNNINVRIELTSMFRPLNKAKYRDKLRPQDPAATRDPSCARLNFQVTTNSELGIP
ncbi:hypothetical protein Mapa_015728 [Marchantia paleacea]|nr:hypothetical protein Mapa_015728 [Marchantia paleacea]